MHDEKLVKEDLLTSPQFRLDLDGLIQITAEIASSLVAVTDLDELVDAATLLIRQRLGYDQVTIQLLDSERHQFTLKIQSSAGQMQATHSCLPDNFASLAHRAVRRRSVICIGDMLVDAPSFYQPAPDDIRSELHIPLQQNSDIMGVLSIGSRERYIFSNSEIITVVKTLAAQLSGAIERVYQHEHKAKGQADTRIYSQVANMHHILPELQSQTGGVHEVFDKVVRGVIEGLGYTAALLCVVDEKQQTLPVQAIAYSDFNHYLNWGLAERVLGIQIIGNFVSLARDQNNLAVQTCLTGKTNVTHNLYQFFQPVVNQEICNRIQESTRIATCVAIPLKVENKVVGILCAGTEKNEICAADLDALHFFVTNAAIAIQNSIHFGRVYQNLMLREAELGQLRRIERLINSSLDLEVVLKHILNGALELTHAEYSQVVLAGKYATDLIQQVSYPQDDAVSLVSPELIDLLNHLPAPEISVVKDLLAENKSADELTGFDQPVSVLSAVISLHHDLIGVLSIASRREQPFTEQSQEMLDQIAVQAAIAIRNAFQFKTEQEIRERLANVSQVVAMGDMASNMVHSINNWVGAIRADVKYLMRQQSQEKLELAEERELLTDILANAESTLVMAENIKKPFQPSEQELVNVNECILHVLQEKRSDMMNSIILEDLQPVPPVMATRQLELVFDNLLNNALQAMKDQMRGVVKFTSRLSKDRRWVLVTVQDSGAGLPAQLDPADIFKLGVSGRDDGLGYGLWWCDTFLKRWGGEIQYVSNTKRGCKFLVKLPISELNGVERNK